MITFDIKTDGTLVISLINKPELEELLKVYENATFEDVILDSDNSSAFGDFIDATNILPVTGDLFDVGFEPQFQNDEIVSFTHLWVSLDPAWLGSNFGLELFSNGYLEMQLIQEGVAL